MTLTLLAIGTFGLLGLSVLCPVLALPGYYFRHRFTGQKTALQPRRPDTPLRIEIVLPAHNEEERIGVTLASIHRAIRRLQVDVLTPPSPEVTVCVGANGCTDQTALTARKFPFVSVPEFPKSSKWITLKTLCMASQADWIFLVDAGTLWPENFLSEVLPRIRERENLLAVAPAYRPWRSGWLHQALWFIETCLKRFETLCGGPVSLHGATVGYKVSHLKKALAWLGDRPWLNDDVVIPLILRTLYPDKVILYPVGEVQDAGVKPHRLDLARRHRLVQGNLQWIQAVLPYCFRRNPVAGMVAARRLFRVFWAYWIALTGLGVALASHVVALPLMATLGVLMAISGSFRQFAGAALASFLAPLPMIRSVWPLEVPWK